MKNGRKDPNRLADTKWKCKYHIALPIENEIKQAHGSAKKGKIMFYKACHMVKCTRW